MFYCYGLGFVECCFEVASFAVTLVLLVVWVCELRSDLCYLVYGFSAAFSGDCC